MNKIIEIKVENINEVMIKKIEQTHRKGNTMLTKDIINLKTVMFGACVLALTACGSDSDSDGDGGGSSGYVGTWTQQDCELDGDTYKQTTLKFTADGQMINSETEYSDDFCETKIEDSDDQSYTYTLGDSFEETSDGGTLIKGKEIDFVADSEDPEDNFFTVISNVLDDTKGIGKHFLLGNEATGEMGVNDGSSAELRIDSFGGATKFIKIPE